jgi:spore coat polysaccharide biosynthesis protein SpsF
MPERRFPRGLDVEVMTFEALTRAWREDRNASWREHVTCYIYCHAELFRLRGFLCPQDHSVRRWTVDTPEDLALIRAVCERVDPVAASWRDVWELIAREPAVAGLNRDVRQKELGEG